jgi:glycogen phosphorylase
MKHVGSVDGEGCGATGADRFESVVHLPFAGLTGYTVRVLPSNPLLASPVELGKIVLAG